MTGTGPSWLLADSQTRADLTGYLRRAARLDPGGAARVQGIGQVLAVYVGGRYGGAGPTVLGLRTMALAEPSDTDVVVPLAALSDRLARTDLGTRLPVPPQQVLVGWAGLLPPRTGWQPVERLEPAPLHTAATEVAEALGFGAPPVTAHRCGRWYRLSSRGGHVLAREQLL